jgi:hypothetical protein
MTTTILESKSTTFAYRDRARLAKDDDPRTGQSGVIVRVLENPSKKPEHQWYDIRFDDGTYGRFLEKHLERTR